LGTHQRDHVIQQVRLAHHHPRTAFMVDMRDMHVKMIYRQLLEQQQSSDSWRTVAGLVMDEHP
jgi:hypothetical protein